MICKECGEEFYLKCKFDEHLLEHYQEQVVAFNNKSLDCKQKPPSKAAAGKLYYSC